MTEEIISLETNKIWDIVPPPLGVSIIGSKWVYFVKLRWNGSLDIYTARSVAQGYKQNYGKDYDETFPF